MSRRRFHKWQAALMLIFCIVLIGCAVYAALFMGQYLVSAFVIVAGVLMVIYTLRELTTR